MKKRDIHYHKFEIYCKFFIFKKLIGYKYMKCGQILIKTKMGKWCYRYPNNLPKDVGIKIFKVGEFGDIPNEKNISENKDATIIKI